MVDSTQDEGIHQNAIPEASPEVISGDMGTSAPRRSDDAMRDRAELAEIMRRMGDRMRRRFHQVVADFDLTPPLYAMLRELDEPLPMGAAAERLCLDASYITGIADRLEGLGLVERRPDPGDRRVKQLVLTHAGEAMKTEIAKRIEAEHDMFPELDEDDIRHLIRIFTKVLDG
ncbi:MAG: MarR family transcriptional regulator [Acidimicrobiia bacterium]|nr:MarR family transcriptional regulator [Acidimicrobiia bacterium]